VHSQRTNVDSLKTKRSIRQVALANGSAALVRDQEFFNLEFKQETGTRSLMWRSFRHEVLVAPP